MRENKKPPSQTVNRKTLKKIEKTNSLNLRAKQILTVPQEQIDYGYTCKDIPDIPSYRFVDI